MTRDAYPAPTLPIVKVPVPQTTAVKVRDLIASGHKRGVIVRSDDELVEAAEKLLPNGVTIEARSGHGVWRWKQEGVGYVQLVPELVPLATSTEPVQA